MFLINMKKQQGKMSPYGTFPFTLLLIGFEVLMDREFSCPCVPWVNAILISFIFVGPALLALTLMMFFKRPCKQKGKRSPTLGHFLNNILPLLVPPLVWMFLLLFEGEYIACGVTHWEGDYILDEEIKIKWCKPSGLNYTGASERNLREQTELIMFYSKISALALLLVFCFVGMAAVIYRDCVGSFEQSNEATQQSETLHESQVELQHQSV